jgi:PLP dependent protein
MHELIAIKSEIAHYATLAKRNPNNIQLLAVTKNQPSDKIEALLKAGQRLFGENRVQEAYAKWPTLRAKYDVELHLIGHLQTNKVRDAIAFFDTIQTLDSLRLADKLAIEQEKQKKFLNYYIEINIGREAQKTGVWPEDFNDFLNKIRTYYPLNVQGIMCIPPLDKDSSAYFQNMKQIADDFHLPIISMGMSHDYKDAILCGATLIRIGTALFN